MKIVFMGTPDFAVPCLEKIINCKHEVCAVFSRADKPVGRKQVLTPPPVKITALKYGIPVYQPEKVKNNPEIINLLKSIQPDAIAVVAYGRILPPEILNIPKYGCINLHGSLLPRHRGASPIQWSIVCGDKKTGVTTMLMDEGMDTGDILEQKKIEILPDETAQTLHDKMSVIGADLLCSTLQGLENGSAVQRPQPTEGASYAPIITKQMGNLSFLKTADELDCLVRGFNPWPLTYFIYNGRRFKVFKAKAVNDINCTYIPGTYFEQNEKCFISCAEKSALQLLEICPEGSKRMNSSAFINGKFIPDGSVI